MNDGRWDYLGIGCFLFCFLSVFFLYICSIPQHQHLLLLFAQINIFSTLMSLYKSYSIIYQRCSMHNKIDRLTPLSLSLSHSFFISLSHITLFLFRLFCFAVASNHLFLRLFFSLMRFMCVISPLVALFLFHSMF